MKGRSFESLFLVITILAVLICCCGGSCYKVTGTKDTVVATVNDKLTKRNGKSDKYLIFTDKEVFEVTDEMLAAKWNSSDIYGSITVGETYEFEVIGWRIPFFSSYRNIMEVKEVSSETNTSP